MAARWWLAFLRAGRLLTFLDAVPGLRVVDKAA